jgi:hypothetical protein
LRGHLHVELLADEIPHDPTGPQREIELELPWIATQGPGVVPFWCAVSGWGVCGVAS